MCAECNLGVGRQSVYPWIAIPLIRAYIRRFDDEAERRAGDRMGISGS